MRDVLEGLIVGAVILQDGLGRIHERGGPDTGGEVGQRNVLAVEVGIGVGKHVCKKSQKSRSKTDSAPLRATAERLRFGPLALATAFESMARRWSDTSTSGLKRSPGTSSAWMRRSKQWFNSRIWFNATSSLWRFDGPCYLISIRRC